MKRNLLFLLFLVISLFLLPVVQASGNPTHDHGTVSPFDKQKYGHRLHCEFKQHGLKDIYCPHRVIGKNLDGSVIALDCGGNTAGTLPIFGSYNTSVFSSDTVHFDVELVLVSREIAYIFYGLGFFLPDQIDRPPQTV